MKYSKQLTTENKVLKEFKSFALKGNVMDLAVAVIIGTAFGKIINSLVNDVIMPLIGLIVGTRDYADWFISLDGKYYKTLAEAIGVPTLKYGVFLTNIIDFVLIAFSVFIFVRLLSKLKSKPTTLPTTRECPYCISTISLKAVKCPNCTSDLKKVV